MFHIPSGREQVFARARTGIPIPADVLRRTEAEMGARSGRLLGNGLIWQYPEKAWYFSQIKRDWHVIFLKEHLRSTCCQENTAEKNQIAVFLPTFISTINEPSPSFHQHYQLHTPKTAQFKWGEVMWNFMSGFNSLCKIIIIQFTLTLIYVLLQCDKRFITEVCLLKGDY